MPGYRLYFMDEKDHIADVAAFDEANDPSAVRRAETQSEGRAMELWCRDRVIRRFPSPPKVRGVAATPSL